MTRTQNTPPRWVWSPTPARALSIAAAREQMRHYADAGLVNIITDGPRMTIGGRIAGVQHAYMTGATTRDVRKTIDNLDPRFGVLLVRLDSLLANMGVSTVLDMGITHGGSDLDDVHNQGRAIDIGGLIGDGIDLRVLRDWGQRPEQGAYRLSIGDPGYALFGRIYELGTQEGADRNTKPEGGVPTQIGDGSYILTPDHPDPKLHKDHQNHIHMQIGRTRGTEP